MRMSFFFLCYCHLVAKKASVLKCALVFSPTSFQGNAANMSGPVSWR